MEFFEQKKHLVHVPELENPGIIFQNPAFLANAYNTDPET